MKSPVVSIGIFVYNESEYISEAVQSVLKQTYTNLEIVISDNCSNDGTSVIIQKFADADQRIKFFSQDSNIGAFDNYKFVFENSSGDYFMWMGGHDVLEPTLIEKAIRAHTKNENAVLVYPNSEFINADGEKTGKSANSDIKNTGLNRFDRTQKLLKNIKYCTAIYGIFKIKYLGQVPLIKMVGSDNLLLFYIAYLGEIVELEKVLYYRREIRNEGSTQERLERYKLQGVNNHSNHPNYNLIYYHLRSIISMKEISLNEKWKLITMVWNKYPLPMGKIRRVNLYIKSIIKRSIN